MGDERFGLQAAICQHVENCLEVSLFRPANEAEGIILALVLVAGIVSPRPV